LRPSALLQEATPPHPDGALGQAELVPDAGVGPTSGGKQDDPFALVQDQAA
jgi:hypothetical protein